MTRRFHWLAVGALLLASVACRTSSTTSRRLTDGGPVAQVQVRVYVDPIAYKLDLLFMVDNSASMVPLQRKLQAQLGAFIDALVDPRTGQLPDLHIGVISSSFGAGAWGNVPSCGSGSSPGDDRGYFQQGPGGAGNGTCTMLHAGAGFLSTGDVQAPASYDGDVRDALKCIAALGGTGCAFRSPFESTYYALYYALQPRGSQGDGAAFNGGFLRDDAKLAIVMVTNGDDCSVASDSLLLKPTVNSVNDPSGVGVLSAYRCNEFGHLCGGQPPPHEAPGSPLTLTSCVSAEDLGKIDTGLTDPSGAPDPTKGHLWPTVAEFSSYVKSLKSNPDDILVAAIAGPPTPYVVSGVKSPTTNELVPAIEHSCVQAPTDPTSADFADPAVRIKQWTDSFGANGVFYPICAQDLKMAVVGIAAKVAEKVILRACLTSAILDAPDGSPDCQVTETVGPAGNAQTKLSLPFCDRAPAQFPCWKLVRGEVTGRCPTGQEFRVCRDAGCSTATEPTTQRRLAISCSVAP